MKALLMFFGAILLAGCPLAAQGEYPLVVRADVPQYPPLARMAKITGKIEAEFTVKNGEVVNAEAKSGHPLLVKATTDNIKTWRFSSKVSGMFATTFDYQVEGSETATMQNPKIEMRLPAFVRITATPTRPPCNDCEPGADVIGKPIKGEHAAGNTPAPG
jgi:hypothetical protein